MIEYKYNKQENKFTENGHTMFESDVLRRLQRLADLEDRIKQRELLEVPVIRQQLRDAAEIISILKSYGMIYTVKGVSYPEGSHKDFIDRASEWLNAFHKVQHELLDNKK